MRAEVGYVGSRGAGLLGKVNRALPVDPRVTPVNGFTDIYDKLGRRIKGWRAPYPGIQKGIFAPLAVDLDDDEREAREERKKGERGDQTPRFPDVDANSKRLRQ